MAAAPAFIPPWHVLRSWCVPKAAQVTLTISILGTLLLASEALWPKVAKYFCDCSNLGFRELWRLYTIYYGSIVFVCGTALFHLFCPSPIKIYATVLDYVEDRAKVASDRHLGTTIAELNGAFKAHGDAFPNQKQMYENELGEDASTAFDVSKDQESLGTKHRGRLNAIVRIDYEVQDLMNPFRRSVVGVVLLAAFAAMAVPTLWTIYVITARLF